MDWDRRFAKRAVRAILGGAFVMVLLAPTALAGNIGAAGDIADRPGGNRNHVATANLLGANAISLVLTLGDNQYPCGELEFYQEAYGSSWGRYRSITRPAPGNHEYLNNPDLCVDPQPTAEGYYTYFQGRTPPHPGYYSFDYQGWHFVVLNTTCGAVPGGCGGAMLTWLKVDLAANRDKRCTVVYGHHPYQSSAFPYYGTPELKAIWPTLVAEDVDLFLAGHNHGYERLAPMRTGGVPDSDWGPGDGDDGNAGVPIVVAGTGGRSLYSVTRVHPQSQARLRSYGIFKLVPNYPAAGQWVQAFKTTSGATYDRKAFRCH
jgi:hypothetical protein